MVEQNVALADWLKPFVEKLGHKNGGRYARYMFWA